jgi:mono/diheme cytochrome c family protein
MKHCAWMLLSVALPQLAAAQQPEPTLTAMELTGRNLFVQHCGVCHVKMQVTTGGQRGPVLSKASLGGQEDVMREFISNGTPNMPGFKYTFQPDEIAAIVAYLKTVPVPPPATAPAATAPAAH